MNGGMICKTKMTLKTLLFDFVKENKLLIFFYIILALQIPLNSILIPHVFGKLYKTIQSSDPINRLLLVIIGLIFLTQIVTIANDYLEVYLHPLIQKYVREKMIKHVYEESQKRYEEVEIGELIAKIIKLPSIVYNYIDDWKGAVVPCILLSLGVLIYMAIYDIQGAIFLLFVLGITFYTMQNALIKCLHHALHRDEMFNHIFGQVDDVLRNLITILTFDTMEDELHTIDTMHLIYKENTENSLNCTLYRKSVLFTAGLLFMILYIAYTYYRVQTKKMDISIAISLIIIVVLLCNNIMSVTNILKDLVIRLGIIKYSLSAFEECTIKRIIYDKPARLTQGICIQDMTFGYISKSKNKIVFNDFNLDIYKSSKTLIVGSIGSGKSSLINLLLKFQHPQEGDIFIDGVPYSSLTPCQLRKRIAYIPQTPILLNRTVYENISYGLHKSRDEVEALIGALNLSTFIEKKLPDGLDTNVGKYGSKLSGGQRQIIWIIKVLMMNPDIVIMDEPTSAIDESTKEIIQQLIDKFMTDKTIIMITHDPYLMQYADRVIELQDGHIISDKSRLGSVLH